MQEEGDQEEDTTDDSSYKLGPDDNNSNEFDERRVESGGGEGVERSEGGVQGVDFVKNDSERARALCVERDVGSNDKGCLWATLCLENKVEYDYMIHMYGVKMNDAIVFRALKLAHEICEGQEKEQYAKLRDYANELLKKNHGSTIGLQIFANFIKKFNITEYERTFWVYAKEITQHHFAEVMMVFERLNKGAAKWLNDIPTDRLSMLAFDTMLSETIWKRFGFDHIQPPIVKRKSGKQKTKGKKTSEEDANPHKMKMKLGLLRCLRCKHFKHKKSSCKDNLGDGDSAATTEEARPYHVLGDGDSVAVSDGANNASTASAEEARQSHVLGDGDLTAAGDGVNDALTAA
ncbi:hypothetical protein CRG98_021131 [Punica granatum]|uniref:Uncharacterized protein n=1 Tax=Punica granatum TaxID=22663 RepID=A0A2I0JSJ4_PUNGR|nr:hypothetical protein CRG98_021131 [Punica granatum]